MPAGDDDNKKKDLSFWDKYRNYPLTIEEKKALWKKKVTKGKK